MGDWKSQLRRDPTDWLLGEDNPSVRYFTLVDLCDKPLDDPDVRQARMEIMERGAVPEILSLQSDPEYIAKYPRFYTYKYRGLVWQLIILAELGAADHPAIPEQCEYLLGHAQERTAGGFAQNTAARSGGGRLSEVIPCLSGNMVWSLIRFGYLDDLRVQRGIDWLTTHMRFNDGIESLPQVDPYARYEMCWGKHTCHMGVVKGLKALAAIPQDRRTPEVERTIEAAAEFMLQHHIYRRSHDLRRMSKPGWRKLSFPLMYQTDMLEILDILTALGIKDPRMNDAVSVVLGKQNEHGRWVCGNSYINERILVPLESLGQESKWLTLRAMRMLRRFCSEIETGPDRRRS